jgi:methylase of polypeptide subunit release factors
VAGIPAAAQAAFFDLEQHRIAVLEFVRRIEEARDLEGVAEVDGILLQRSRKAFVPQLGHISLVFLREIVERRSRGRVLDVGTGSGVYALAAARSSAAVVATDISQEAIEVAKGNAELNNLRNVEFRVGSMFDAIAATERFDVILANLPFTAPKHARAAENSAYYGWICMREELLDEFVRGSVRHLAPGGVVYFTYGSSGNLERLASLIDETRYEWGVETVMERRDLGETFFIFSLSLRQ